MTPFLIFAIVLTIAYILYYATIITMDLYGKGKKKGNEELMISTGEPEDGADIAPQSVVENSDGGFDFIKPEEEADDKQQEDVNEQLPAEEEEAPEMNITRPSNNVSFEDDATEGTELTNQQTEVEEEVQSSPTEETDAEVQEQQTSAEDSVEEEQEEVYDNIQRESFDASQPEKAPVTEDSGEEDKHDPFFNVPKHQVSSMHEKKGNPVVREALDNITGTLFQVTGLKGGLFSPEGLNEAVSDGINTLIECENVVEGV